MLDLKTGEFDHRLIKFWKWRWSLDLKEEAKSGCHLWDNTDGTPVPMWENLMAIRNVLSCALKPTRPFHIATCGEYFLKSIARFWAKFADEKCVMGAWGACQAEGEEKEKAIESAAESFAFLEKQLQGNK
ncbi:hypothetical protein LWI29_026781 [Acer saccharum]|uniref:Uncharacterized protein n=1 Tax=Acer saccharum TaxID=4024 RepID=A0AA39VQJ0_ACESA|nr:hypothetical protein LWI29_026781 [Acer saccharum]